MKSQNPDEYYDLSVVNALDQNQVMKNYVPSVQFVTNNDGNIYKVILKWYVHDGTSYVAVTDLSQFWLAISRLTLRTSTSYDTNFDLGQTEFLLDTPIDPNDANSYIGLFYGFYVSEIDCEFRF